MTASALSPDPAAGCDNEKMTGHRDVMSLRERKKARTRETIRHEALRLIDEQGYANTTVEQIAAASEVSSSTVFRYFPNKAALLIPDQLLEPIIELFIAAPAELSPVAAYRYAVEQVFDAMTGDQWGPENERQRLLYTLPEAAGALYGQYINTIELITAGLAQRLNRPGDDPELRTTAGAITGVFMATLHGTPMTPGVILPALDFLAAGLPLTKG